MSGVLDGKVAVVTGTSRGVGVGIAHELLRAGATVVGCSRSALDGLPGTADNPEWASRSSQLVCDQGDLASIDAFIAEVVASWAARHSGQQRGRNGSRAPRRGHPRTGLPNPGRAAKRRRLRTHGAVPPVRHPDEPDQPDVVRDPRQPPDAHPGRHRLRHQYLQRCRSSRRVADAGLLRCGQERAESPHEVARAGVGAEDPGELCCVGAHDHRELPIVRIAEG